jgi:hypothetical protein
MYQKVNPIVAVEFELQKVYTILNSQIMKMIRDIIREHVTSKNVIQLGYQNCQLSRKENTCQRVN